jgi:hypothetical protein
MAAKLNLQAVYLHHRPTPFHRGVARQRVALQRVALQRVTFCPSSEGSGGACAPAVVNFSRIAM